MARDQDSVTLFGVIDTRANCVNYSAALGENKDLLRFGDGATQGSGWGVRGSDDVGGGLSAVFPFENGFSADGGSFQLVGAEYGGQACVGVDIKGGGSSTLDDQYPFSTDYLGTVYSISGWTSLENYASHINDHEQFTSSAIDSSLESSSANLHEPERMSIYASRPPGGYIEYHREWR